MLAWVNPSHYMPWLNFEAEAMALSGLGLLALVYGLAIPRREPLRWHAPSQVVLLVAFVPALQWVSGLTPFFGDAFVSCAFLCALSASMLLGYNLGGAAPPAWMPGSGEFINGALLWLPALVSASIGLVQWLDLTTPLGVFAVEGYPGARAIGNMAQANLLASLLLMGMCGAWFDFERGRLGRLSLIILLVFLGFGFVLTQSRAGLLSASVLGGFLWFKARKHADTAAWRIRPWQVLLWMGLMWLAFISVPLLGEALLIGGDRSISLLNPNSRDIIWLQVLTGIGQAPWFGYGWNQTLQAQQVGALTIPGRLSATYAHNLSLDLIAWAGIPLGLLLAGLLGWWAITRARRVRSVQSVAAFAALIPIGVHSQLEFPFAYAFFLVAAGLLAGVVDAQIEPRSHSLTIGPRAVALVAALWTIAGLYSGWQYLRAEDDFRVVRFEGMGVGQTPNGYEPPKIHLLTHLDALLRAGRIEPRVNMPAHELEVLGTVSQRFPYGAIGKRYALALALNGETEAAVRQYRMLGGVYGRAFYLALMQELRQEQDRWSQLRPLLMRLQGEIPPVVR
ncbi:MAG: O-antigen ligase family protein [Tibeticola sp.]